MNEDDHLAAKPRTLNLQPEQIRHAAISHLHYGHSGGVGELPNATIYVQEDELKFAHYPPVYQRDIYVKWTLDQAHNWKALRGTTTFSMTAPSSCSGPPVTRRDISPCSCGPTTRHSS